MLIVGSSNFSFTALKTGDEWNLAMNLEAEPYMFQHHETTLAVNPEMIQRITEMEKVEFGTRLPDEKNDNFQNSIMYYTD